MRDPGKAESPIRRTRWAAPIAAECRYWADSWNMGIDKNLPNITVPANVEPSMTLWTAYGPQRPKKAYPNLIGKKISITRRDHGAGQETTTILDDYFAVLPRRHAADTLNTFAKEGALVLHDHLRSDTSTGPFQALHRATTALLRTDDAYNKRWKRLVPSFIAKAPADADLVLEELMKHVVDQTPTHYKKRMHVFATHAMMNAVMRRAEETGGAKRVVDFRVMLKFWDRLDEEAGF